MSIQCNGRTQGATRYYSRTGGPPNPDGPKRFDASGRARIIHRSSTSPPLAFTRTNAPLLAYEDALLCLLSQIDSVESHGDAEVRRARKALVRRVEGELKRLDGVREAEWERQSGASGSENESGSEADTEEGEDQEMNSSDDEDVQGTFWSTLACFSG